MNRIQFFDSISGIQYPKMIVDFFDHFIALKQIVEDKGSVTVDNNNDSSIEFSIIFKSNNDRDLALSCERFDDDKERASVFSFYIKKGNRKKNFK